jgi:uncharacterized protein YbjT (DUF2867 family)
MPSTILIAGATGVVGQRALHHLLASREVTRVNAIGRRALPSQHPKLTSEVADLNNKADLLANTPDGIDVAICALGTTIKQAGSQPAFRAVDHDAVLTFAEAAKEKGAQRFLLVSSIGANANSNNFYLRVKGETEADLARLGFANLTILRPSFIDPQGTRPENRRGESIALPIAKFLFSIFGKHGRYAPIAGDTLGRALTRLSFDTTTEKLRILEGKPLHEAGAENPLK